MIEELSSEEGFGLIQTHLADKLFERNIKIDNICLATEGEGNLQQLKDKKLTSAEFENYEKMIVSLSETIKVMKEIDKYIPA